MILILSPFLMKMKFQIYLYLFIRFLNSKFYFQSSEFKKFKN